MLTKLFISAISILVTAWLLPGVSCSPWWVSIVVAVVLGLINAFIKPVISFLSLPVTILTLGLFSLVINALMVLLCASIVGGFNVAGFWDALVFAVVLMVVNWGLNAVFGDD